MRIELTVALACTLAGSAAAAPPGSADRGLQLFAITCSSSFCHGDGAVGARGPSLRNRDFTTDFVRTTVLNGRSGTPMPSFKTILKPDELADVVAYVMSLSPNGKGGNESVPPVEAGAAAIPISEQAERGKALFFDQARAAGCSYCHSYQGEGGSIGRDLSTLAHEPAGALYQRMAHPADGNERYPVVTVTTRDGKTASGIKAAQTDDAVRIYDPSSVPPVLRSFYTADGIKVSPSAKPTYAHDLTGYSKTDVADIIAFLQSATGEGKKVLPQDFAQQQEKP